MTDLNLKTGLDLNGKIRAVARVKLTHADLTAVATSQVITLAALFAAHPSGASQVPANARIVDAWLSRQIDFAGGGSASATISVGDAGLPAELLNAVNIWTGAKAAKDVVLANGTYTFRTEEAAYAGQVTVTSDVNVNLLTSGICEVCIEYEAYAARAFVR